MLLCLPGWACQRSLDCWRGRKAKVVGHREQWTALEQGEANEDWIPTGEWDLLTWSMGTWSGLALSQVWGKNPPKSWMALSPFVELCPTEGGKVSREELEVLLDAFAKNPVGTLGMFERRQGGKSLWADGLVEGDYELLYRSLKYLLEPCPWTLAVESIGVPTVGELGVRDRLVGESQSRAFIESFSNGRLDLLKGKNHALFYEDVGED
jgi:hypothetical protein